MPDPPVHPHPAQLRAAVRAFTAAADAGRFQDAATELSITQRAVPKRIAAPREGPRRPLFTHTARLTIDGQALLPRARALLQAEERAIASVAPGRRALRVDVIGRRLAPAGPLRDFHRATPPSPSTS
ncbi:LysR family transcriptional regulator [Actinomadura nitritigenes]|uniref:LysR family transcriptional regulator n=1 Tax=Actinomadura nitritigenes TaxID=134602 RepID=UPI003D8FF164